MNLIGNTLKVSLLNPGIFASAGDQLLKEDWLISEANRELDEEKFQIALENYFSSTLDGSRLQSLIETDTLISWIFLKLKRKIETLKKAVEENWNGTETFKQVEKLENSCHSYLKSLLSVLERVKTLLQHEHHARFIDYVANNAAGFEELLFYSDNLELNFYVLKVYFFIFSEQQHLSQKFLFEDQQAGVMGPLAHNQKNYNVLASFYYYFLESMRQGYPYSVELFKTEKFFKDIGHKPEVMESPNDGVKFTSRYVSLNIGSVKKEFGEHYLSVLTMRGLLQKANVTSYDEKSADFLHGVFALRVAKNFQMLKQRALVFLNMILVSRHYHNGNILPFEFEGKRNIRFDFLKEWRQILAIKGFPLPELYQEIVDQVNQIEDQQESFYKLLEQEKNETLDFQGEKRFVEELLTRLSEDFTLVPKRDLQLQLQTLTLIQQLFIELKFFIVTKNNAEKLNEDLETQKKNWTDIFVLCLEKYAESDRKQEIADGVFNVLHKLPNIVGNQYDQTGILGLENSQRLLKAIENFFQSFINSPSDCPEFSKYDFNKYQLFFQNTRAYDKWREPDNIKSIAQNYLSGNKTLSKIIFHLTGTVDMPSDLCQVNGWNEALVHAFDNSNFQRGTLQQSVKVYEYLKTYVSIQESKGIANLDKESLDLTDRARHLLTCKLRVIGFLPFEKFKIEGYEEDTLYYLNYGKAAFRILTDQLNTFIETVVKYDEVTERSILEHPGKDNAYTGAYFASIVSINAFKRELYVSYILQEVANYIQLGSTTFFEEQINTLLDLVLRVVHPCSSASINSSGYNLDQIGQGIKSFRDTVSFYVEGNQQKPLLLLLIKRISQLFRDNFDKELNYQSSFETLNNFQVNNNAKTFAKTLLEGNSTKNYESLQFSAQYTLLYKWLKNQISYTDLGSENLFHDNDLRSSFESIDTFLQVNYSRVLQEKLQFQIDSYYKYYAAVTLTNNKPQSAGQYRPVQTLGEKQQFKNKSEQNRNIFSLSSDILSFDLFGQRTKDSGNYLIGLVPRLNCIFGQHRFQHLFEILQEKVAQSCLELIPQEIDSSSVESLFSSVLLGIVADTELRKTLRNHLTPINLKKYWERISVFLRQIHAAFERQTLNQISNSIDFSKKETFVLSLLKRAAKQYAQDFFSSVYTFREHRRSGHSNDYSLTGKLILSPNEEIWTQGNHFFQQAYEELNTIKNLFYMDLHYSGVLVDGETHISKIYHFIDKKKGNRIKLEAKIQSVDQFNNYFKEYLAKNSEASRLAESIGLDRASEFVDGLVYGIFHNVINEGQFYNDRQIESLSRVIILQAQSANPAQERVTLALITREISQLIQKLIQKEDNTYDFFKSQFSFLGDFLGKVHALIPENSFFPIGVGSYIKHLDDQVSIAPESYRPIILAFLFTLLKKLSKQWLSLSTATPKDYEHRLFFSTHKQFLLLLRSFRANLQKTSSQVAAQLKMALNLMTFMQDQISQNLFRILPVAKQEFTPILKESLQVVNDLIRFSQQAGFYAHQNRQKDDILVQLLDSVLSLVLVSVTRLKESDGVEQQEVSDISEIIFKLLKTTHKSHSAVYSSIWQNLTRLIDLIFVYEKNNFLRSNFEIRIKTKIFDENEKRFRWTISYAELVSLIDKDMLEHPRELLQALDNLLQSFDEDPQSLQELIQAEAERLKKKKKTAEEGGEEGGEEDPEEQEKKEGEEGGNQREEGGEGAGGEEGGEKKAEGGERAEGEEGGEQQQEQENAGGENQQAQQLQQQQQQQQQEQRVVIQKTIQQKKQKKKIPEDHFVQSPQYPLRKLKLKSYDQYNSSQSNIIHLTVAQRHIIDQLFSALQQRVISNFESAKSASAAVSTIEDSWLSYGFIVKTIGALVAKYPLTMPYIAEKRFQTPQIGLLKLDNYETNFFDYVLLFSAFTNQSLQGFLELYTDISYTFVKENKNKYGLSVEVYAKQFFDRILLWLKKFSERTDFLDKDTNIGIYQSLVDSLLWLLNNKRRYLNTDRIKNAQAYALQILKKSTKLQELDQLDFLRITELLALSGELLLQTQYKTITGQEWNPKTSRQYIQYHQNLNFLQFFDKEKRETLEKLNVIDFATVYTGLPSNSKQNLVKVQPIVHDSCVSAKFEAYPQFEHFTSNEFQRQKVMENDQALGYGKNWRIGNRTTTRLSQYLKFQREASLKKVEFGNSLFEHLEDYYDSELKSVSRFSKLTLANAQSGRLSPNKEFASLESMFQKFFSLKDRKKNWQAQLSMLVDAIPSALNVDNTSGSYMKKKVSDVVQRVEDSDIDDVLEDDIWKVSTQKKVSKFKKQQMIRQIQQERSSQQNQNDEEEELQQLGINQETYKNAAENEKLELISQAKRAQVDKFLEAVQDLFKRYYVASESSKGDVARHLDKLLDENEGNSQLHWMKDGERELFLLTFPDEIVRRMNSDFRSQVEAVKRLEGRYSVADINAGLDLNRTPSTEESYPKHHESHDSDVEDIISQAQNEGEEGQEDDQDSIYTDFLEEEYLTSTLLKDEKIQNALNNIESYLSLVPTLEDDFIIKLIQMLHFQRYTDNQGKYQTQQQSLQQLLDVYLLNPYNAYRYTDFLQFLVVQNIVQRNNFDNPLFDLEIYDNSLNSKFLSTPSKRDVKLLKLGAFLDSLNYCIKNQLGSITTVQFSYPIQKEEYSLVIDGQEKTYQVAFKSLELFKDFKFSAVFKGMNEISMQQINSIALKWLLSEQRQNQFVVDNTEDPVNQVLGSLYHCMHEYFQSLQFQGTQRQIKSSIYPKYIRPESELNFDFISEMITHGQLSHRIRNSEYWNIAKQYSKKWVNYVQLSKAFFTQACKTLKEDIKKLLNDLIIFKAKVKIVYKIEHVNQSVQHSTDVFYEFTKLIERCEKVFDNEMYVLRRSIKDIVHLFETAYAEQRKKLITEYNDKLKTESQEAVDAWYLVEKEGLRPKLLNELKTAWTQDDNGVKGLFADTLEYIYTAIAFAWSTPLGNPFSYRSFNYPLKSFLVIYQFLYGSGSSGGGSQKSEGPVSSSSLKDYKEQALDVSDFQEQSISALETSIQIFSSFKKNLAEQTFESLFDVVKQKLVPLVSYFLSNDFIPKKRRWTQFLKLIVHNQNLFDNLDIEMKRNQLTSLVNFESKNILKHNKDQVVVNLNLERGREWKSALYRLIRLSGPKTSAAQFVINDQLVNQPDNQVAYIWQIFDNLFHEDTGLFKRSINQGALMVNPDNINNKAAILELRYAGRLVAKSILDSQNSGINLSSYLLSRILKKPITLDHLEELDSAFYNEKKDFIGLEIPPDDLYFSYVSEREEAVYDLVRGGRFIPVTEKNKNKYVRALATFELERQYEPLVRSFVRGFWDVIPYQTLKFFNEHDLSILISGINKVDADDLKLNSLFDGGFDASSDQVVYLFQILKSFDGTQLQTFLYKVTGASSVPKTGFMNFNISFNKYGEPNDRIYSVKSQRTIYIPPYETKEKLHDQLISFLESGNPSFVLSK